MKRLLAIVAACLALISCSASTDSPNTQAAATPSQACRDDAKFTAAFTAWGVKWKPLITTATNDMDTKARAGDTIGWKAAWTNAGLVFAGAATDLRTIKTPPEVYLDLQAVADATDKIANISTQFGSSSITFINQNVYQWQQALSDQGTAVTKLSYDIGISEGLNSCPSPSAPA